MIKYPLGHPEIEDPYMKIIIVGPFLNIQYQPNSIHVGACVTMLVSENIQELYFYLF